MGDMSNPSKEVRYEGCFRATTAGFERFGRALINYKIRLMDSYVLQGTVIILIKALPEVVRCFELEAKLHDLKYRSPTLFDNGTLVAMYDSAENEQMDKKNASALRLLGHPSREVTNEQMESLGKEILDTLEENDDRL